jgi:DNA-binding SARP family transcriptional activator
MAGLPPHHVPRPRLVARLRAAPVGCVVAGGGYGKSTLGRELSDALGVATVTAALAPRDGAPALLAARLRRALDRAGLSDASARVDAARADAGAALEALVDALEAESEAVLVVVDDVHHAGTEAGELLLELARDLPPPHRLLLLGRRLPHGVGELARADRAVILSGLDLTFTEDEVADLAGAAGAARALAPGQALALRHATGGWAAALVMAARRLADAQDPDDLLERLVDRPAALAPLVREQLAPLEPEERLALVQLAHLPMLSPDLVADATGRPELFERAVRAGLPLSAGRDGWWELLGPVGELLAERGGLDPDVARRAAGHLAAHGELSAAVQLLLGAGAADDTAALLAGISPRQAERLGYLELQATLDALPAEAVDRHPEVLLHLARACEPAAQVRIRAVALERAAGLLADGRDPALAREVEAERACDLIRDQEVAEAEELAGRLLAAAGPAEVATRARALHVLGRTAAWRRDEAGLAEGERLLGEAISLYRGLGLRYWAVQARMALGVTVHFARGAHEAAVTQLDEALAELPGRSRERAVVLTFRAEVLNDCGRLDEAQSSVDEARRLAGLLGDRRAAAYAAWEAAMGAGMRGDPAATVAAVREVERNRDDWFEHGTGVGFLADAADVLDLVGERDLALGYLARAVARREEAEDDVALAEAAVLARSGDPAEALAALDAVAAMARRERRYEWRVTLLRAHAVMRAGDAGAAGTLAGRAFEQAAAIGAPGLPLMRERAVAEGLVRLAGEAGSAAARDLDAGGLPPAIAALGRFEVSRGGRAIALPPGRPTALVKLLVAYGGRVGAEEAIDALWPDAEIESGRKRLRNVLNRLRAAARDLVERDGEALALVRGVQVDAHLFEAEARRAAAAPRGDPERRAAGMAALSRWRGGLLPDDPYEAWAAEPRERLARRHLDLVDALAAEAEERGELDEALRLLERGIEAEPLDEGRYVRAARLLLAQGRRGPARATLLRGRAVVDELGLQPSLGLQRLERALLADREAAAVTQA